MLNGYPPEYAFSYPVLKSYFTDSKKSLLYRVFKVIIYWLILIPIIKFCSMLWMNDFLLARFMNSRCMMINVLFMFADGLSYFLPSTVRMKISFMEGRHSEKERISACCPTSDRRSELETSCNLRSV